MPDVMLFLGGLWSKIGSIAYVGTAIQGMIVSYAIGRVTEALGMMDQEQGSQNFNQGIKTNNTSNTYAIPVVYGSRKVGGSEWRAVSGANNEYLYRVMVLSEGEIESIDAVYLNDKDVTDSRYANLVEVEKRFGTESQQVSTFMSNVEGWDSNATGKKVAYLVAKLKYDQDVFTSGLPTLTAEIKGRKVYDPRLDSTVAGGNGSHRHNDSTTWEWSDNPALCILDYLTNTLYGRSVPYVDIDLSSFMTEANYCDETITLQDASGALVAGQKRYTCNGIVNTNENSIDILKRLLTSCRGSLIPPSDKFKLRIDKAGTSVFSFDETNIVGDWNIVGASTRSRRNRAVCRFFDKDNNYEESISITTSSGIGQHSFFTKDNNRLLEAELSFPFTNEQIRVDILSQHFLKQSRLNWKVEFTANLKGLKVEAMDIISITHSRVGWVNKPFRVVQMTIETSDTIKISCEEYDNSVYSFDVNTPPSAPQSNLPDPNDPRPPQNLTLDSSELLVGKDGTIIERIDAEWDAPVTAYVNEYEIAWKPATETSWNSIKTRETNFYCSPVSSGVDGALYNVRVRALYTIAGASEWHPSEGGLNHTVIGKTAKPTRPSTFSYSQGSNYSRVFQWTPSTDPDIAGYIIKYAQVTALTDVVEWEGMTELTTGLLTQSPYETNLLSAGFYRFGIKSVDTSGNESENAKFFSAELEDNPILNILQAYYPRLLGWSSVGNSGLYVPTQFEHKVPIGETGSETITMNYDSIQTATAADGTKKTYAYYKSGQVQDYASNFGDETFATYHLRLRADSNIFYWRVQRVEDNTSDNAGYSTSDYSYSYRSYNTSTAPEPPIGSTSGYATDGSASTFGGELIEAGTRTQLVASTTALVDPNTGDLQSLSGLDEEWDDLGTTTWDEWESWSFGLSTLTYETNGFEFGTDLTFRPVVQANAIGSVSHLVSIVPKNSSATSPFPDSAYGNFETPAGEVTAKAIKTRTTITGVNATLQSLSILLDGKRLEEELLGIDTSALDSAYIVTAGHIHLPLVKSFTSIQSIQIVFNNAGSQRTFEVISKTNQVSSKLAPTVKLYNGSSLADATIDIIVKGY